MLRGSLELRDQALSPDGEWIAFTTSGREDLFVVRADGTGFRQLTDDAFRDRGVTWSPDGRRLAFYSDRGGSYEVWTIRPDARARAAGLPEGVGGGELEQRPRGRRDACRCRAADPAGRRPFLPRRGRPKGAPTRCWATSRTGKRPIKATKRGEEERDGYVLESWLLDRPNG